MKQKFYLKLGKDKLHLKADICNKPDYKPIMVGKRLIPTILCGLIVNINEEAFDPARLQLDANIDLTSVAMEVEQTEIQEEQEDD